MRKNIFINLVSSFLSLLLVFSCSPSNNTTDQRRFNYLKTDQDQTKDTPSNENCDEPYKSFNISSLQTQKKPNEALRIKILKKSEDTPIKLSNKYKFPADSVTEFKGFRVAPAVIKMINHKGVDITEAKENKEEFFEKLRELSKAKYEIEKDNKKHKENRIKDLDSFIKSVKDIKNKIEKNNLIKEQIELRKELVYEKRDERIELKTKYTKDIEQLEKVLYLENKNDKSFKTKAVNTTINPNNIDYLNFQDGSQNYNEVDANNSYEIDGTYTNGIEYVDTTQLDEPLISQYIGDYELPDQDAEKIQALGIQIDGCAAYDKFKVQQINNTVSIMYEKLTDGCTVANTEVIYKVVESDCGQASEIKIQTPSGRRFFGMKVEIPPSPLGAPKKVDIFLRVTGTNGNSYETKVGSLGGGNAFKTLAENKTLLSSDIEIAQNQISIDSVRNKIINKSLPPSDYDLLKDLGDQHTIAIHKTPFGGSYTFKIVNSLGDTVCSSNCATLTDTNITIKKTALDNDEYKLEIYSNGNLVKTTSFFNTKVFANTFIKQADYVENTETAFTPTPTSFLNNPIEAPLISPSELGTNLDSLRFDSSFINECLNVSFFKKAFSSLDNNYLKRLVQEVFTDTNNQPTTNNLYSSEVNSCSDKSILVGAIVDLTNKNIEINNKLSSEGDKIALLSLSVEDAYCNVLQSWNFVAKIGTTHFITKQFFPSTYGSFCEKKVFYVKVKKLVLQNPAFTTGLSQNQGNYMGVGTNKIDVVPYVKNSAVILPNNLKYEGTQGILSKCDTELCGNDFSNLNQFIISSKNNNSLISQNYIKLEKGDKFDLFYSSVNTQNLNLLGGALVLTNPLNSAIASDSVRETVVLDDNLIIKITTAESEMYRELVTNNKNLADFQTYESTLENDLNKLLKYNIQATTSSLETNTINSPFNIARDAVVNDIKNIEKSTQAYVNDIISTSRKINYNNRTYKIASDSLPRIASTVFSVSIIAKEIIEKSTELYNLKTKTNLDYMNDLKKATDTIKKVKDKLEGNICDDNADRLVLERASIYITHFLLKRLYNETNLDVNVWSPDYNNELKNSSDIIYSISGSLDEISVKIEHECEEKACESSEWNVKTGNYFIDNTHFSRKTIKCRIKNTYDFGAINPRNPFDVTTLAKNHDAVNEIKIQAKNIDPNSYSEINSASRTFGFGNVYKNDTNNSVEYLKAINSGKNSIDGQGFVPNIGQVYTPPFFDPSDFLNNQNKKDTEIKMIEYVMGKYVLTDTENNKYYLNIFTDRITCDSCNNIIDQVIHSNKYIAKTSNFKVTTIEPNPIFKLGEQIPIEQTNYYSILIK